MKFKNILLLHSIILSITFAMSYSMTYRQQDKLAEAVRNNDTEQLNEILQNSNFININKKYGKKAHTLLHYAALSRAHETAKILIENGAGTNIKNFKKRTPMWYAFNNCDLDMILLLVESGANVNETYLFGQTLLHLASREGDYKLTKLLIENRANVNAEDELGDKPLNEAMQNRNQIIATLLMTHGAQMGQSNTIIINLEVIDEETEEDSSAGEDTVTRASEVEIEIDSEAEEFDFDESEEHDELQILLTESLYEHEPIIGELTEEEQENSHSGYVGIKFMDTFKCCICQEDKNDIYVTCNKCIDGLVCYECFSEKDLVKKMRWNNEYKSLEYLVKCPNCRNPYSILHKILVEIVDL